MSRRKPKGRPVNGILLLDKPIGGTSNAVLQQVKRLYQAAKAGHTGSLDPLASGLLPICFGQATKISAYLLDADKEYEVTATLGARTNTGDATGEIVERSETTDVSPERLQQALHAFRGTTQQIPPMYSALKHKGKRLYALAREGIEVERKPRSITIHQLELLNLDANSWTLRVQCSKGTYVRTLVEDIAAAAGTLAHVSALRRTAVGPFSGLTLVTMAQLEETADQGQQQLDALLQPIDRAIMQWPSVQLARDSAWYLQQGHAISVPRAPSAGWVRLYGENSRFIGTGEILADGRIAPRRIFSSGNGC